MTGEPAGRRRGFILEVVGRPLMFVFWSLIVWGTFLVPALAWKAVTNGFTTTWRQVLSGRDGIGGRVNLGLAACALLVWGGVATALWRARRRTRAPADPKSPPRLPRY